MPVQLEELSHKNLIHLAYSSKLAWDARTELRKKYNFFLSRNFGQLPELENGRQIYDLAMPVISPGFPEDNVHFNTNQSTAEIIQREMREGKKFIYIYF